MTLAGVLDRLYEEAKERGCDLNDLNAYHDLLALAETTTVELIQQTAERVESYRTGVGPGAAGREFSLALTALEDATMRFNRGMAEMRGVRRDFDFEKDRP